jgi:hypothetical protein
MHLLTVSCDDTAQCIPVMGNFDSNMDWIKLAQGMVARGGYKFPIA